MNKFHELFKLFESERLDKKDYIDKAYTFHDILFEYSGWLSETNISEIVINDNKVFTKFRESGVEMELIRSDKRIASIDTLNFKEYESEELNLQISMMKDFKNVLDIGGNYGWYALHLANALPNATIYTFEPIPLTYQVLLGNINRNGCKNIIPFNFGFSEETGVFDFFIDSKLTVNASMTNLSESDNTQKIKCFTRSLDEFVVNSNVEVDFIKCDVEGAELRVFKGGLEVFRNQKPIVFTEMLRKWSAKFGYHPNDIISFFSDLDYNCFVIDQNRLCEIISVDDTTKDTNFIFLNKIKHSHEISKYVING